MIKSSFFRCAVLVTVTLCCTAGAYSQDVIVKKSGEKVEAKVLEIGISGITYKKFSNPDGPSYVIPKSEVDRITYENGTEDTFGDQPVPGPRPGQQNEVAAEPAGSQSPAPFSPFLSAGFNGILHNGIFGSTVPARPDGGTFHSTGGDPYLQFGFGVNIDYHFIPNLALHFDINAYSNTTPVAYKNGYASSFWVYEMTGYSNNLIGPFSEDANYTVSATGMRLGLRLYPLKNSKIQPWYGLYYGYYTWRIGVFSKDKKSTYGNTSGSVSDFMLMNFGADFWNKDKTFGTSIFAEFGSPVARNYKIENCLKTGWTLQDYGEGSHLFGYNRIGVSLNFGTKKKK